MTNPYVIAGIVEDPQLFFGRQTHLRRLLRRVEKMDCASVVGPPGIGKSSLLYQLSRQGELQETHVSLYLDLSDVALQGQRAFLRRVIEELGRRIGRIFIGSTVDRLEQVLNILRDDEKLAVLLCLDDFDQLAVAPWVADAFLDELCRLGCARLLSLVAAFPRPPEELAREGVIARTFPRLFDEQIDLGLLSAWDAARLIRQPALEEGVEFAPEAIELARELGGRHPLYLQLVGYHLFEQVLTGVEMDLEAVRERFAEAAFPHLHMLWLSLTSEEREASRYYAGVASARPPGVSTQQELIRRGLVERRAGQYCLFSEHFQDVVRRRRLDLEEPLPVPEEVPSRPESQAAARAEEATVEVVAPLPRERIAPEEATQEFPAALPTEEMPVPAGASPEPVVGLPEAALTQPEPSVEPSPQEITSLAALGCYVVALALDLLCIIGIVVGRVLFQLPTQQTYILMGMTAVFPILILLLNRLSGGLSVRFFGWLLRRLEHR